MPTYNDPQYLMMISHWIGEMHKMGRFKSCRQHGDAVVAEMMANIDRIAGRLAQFEKMYDEPDGSVVESKTHLAKQS